MQNTTTHVVSAFLKPNGYIVFALTSDSDKESISADLQAQYGGGSLLRQFTLNLPVAISGAITKMVSQAIFLADYPSITSQLELIDCAFSREAIAA